MDGVEDNEMNLGNVRDTKEGRIVYDKFIKKRNKG